MGSVVSSFGKWRKVTDAVSDAVSGICEVDDDVLRVVLGVEELQEGIRLGMFEAARAGVNDCLPSP